jgi:hypothetical protein
MKEVKKSSTRQLLQLDNGALKTIFRFLELKALSLVSACSRNAKELLNNVQMLPTHITFDTNTKYYRETEDEIKEEEDRETPIPDDAIATFFLHCHSLFNFHRFCSSLTINGALEPGLCAVLSMVFRESAEVKTMTPRVRLTRLTLNECRLQTYRTAMPLLAGRSNSLASLAPLNQLTELCLCEFSIRFDSAWGTVMMDLPVSIIKSLRNLQTLEFVSCEFQCTFPQCFCKKEMRYAHYMGESAKKARKECTCIEKTASLMFQPCPFCGPVEKARRKLIMASTYQGFCSNHLSLESKTVTKMSFKDCLGIDPLDAFFNCSMGMPALQSFSFAANGTFRPVGFSVQAYEEVGHLQLTTDGDKLLRLGRKTLQSINLVVNNEFPEFSTPRLWLHKTYELLIEYVKKCKFATPDVIKLTVEK